MDFYISLYINISSYQIMASEIDSSLTTDGKDRIIKRPTKQVWLFSLSIITGNMIWFVFGRLQLFFTETVGLAIGTFTLISTIYMIWNMFNDPLEGYLTDRSSPKFTRKYGKRAPFVFIGHLGGSVAIALPFIVMGDIETNPTLVATWLCISMCVFDAFMSLMGITMPGLQADKFRHSDQRKLIGLITIVYAIIGMLFGVIAFPMIIAMLTPTLGAETAWLIGACVMGGISFVISFLMIPGIREDEELKNTRAELDEKQKTENFFVILWRSIQDKDFVIFLISIFLYGTSISLIITALDYWVIYGLGMELTDTMTPLLAFMFVAPLVAPLWFWLSKKIGSKKSNIIGYIGFGISVLLFMFVKDMTGTIIVMALCGITSSIIGTNQAVIGSNIMDQLAISLKVRQEGSLSGVLTIFSRLQLLFLPLIFMIVQGATGWVPLADIQSPQAIFGVRLELSLIPGLFLIIAGIIFGLFYSITPEKAEENHHKMTELGF